MQRSGSRWTPTGETRQDADGYWFASGLRPGVDYRLRYHYFDYYGLGPRADGGRVAGGCHLDDAPALVIGRDQMVRRTGAVHAPARWRKAGPHVQTRAPEVRGTARVGARLTVDPGAWMPCGWAATYEWRRDGVTIRGATGSSYRPTRADAGRRLAVLVTVRATGGDGYAPFRDRGTTSVVTASTAAVRR